MTCSFFAHFISGVLVSRGLGHFSLGAETRDPHLSDAETSMSLDGIPEWPIVGLFPALDRKANTHWLLSSQQWFKIDCVNSLLALKVPTARPGVASSILLSFMCCHV